MTTLLIVLLCILIPLTAMLLAPIEIEVDSTERRISLRLFAIARLTFQGGHKSQTAGPQVQILSKTIEIKPSKSAAKSAGDNGKTVNKRQRRRPGLKRLLPALPDLFAGVWRAVHIKEFRAALDSRDFVLNAQLFALQPWLAAHGLPIHVNFNNHTMLRARIVLSIGRLLLTALKFAWRVFLVSPSLKHQTEGIP